jgi:hypothetical protein
MNKTLLFGTLAATLTVALAQQTATVSARLVYSDGRTHTLHVLNLNDGSSLASFGTPGKVTYVASSDSGQTVIAAHRDDSRVTVLSSGLSLQDHGDHQDLVEKAPHVLATMNLGKQPTHLFNHGKTIAFFNDGDGTVAILDEDKLGLSLDFEQIKTAQPDHAGLVVLENRVLVGYLRLGRVDVFERGTGKLLQTLPGCPALHGETMHASGTYWGCSDGVLLTTPSASGFTATKFSNPAGTPENTRVGTLVSSQTLGFAVGNFGKGLAFITPGKPTLETMALPDAPVKMEFAASGRLVVLTANGQLHTLDATTRSVTASLAVTPAVTASGEGAVRPSFALLRDRAFVTSPTTGEILEVNLSSMKLERRFKVGGTPVSVAVVSAEGVKH